MCGCCNCEQMVALELQEERFNELVECLQLAKRYSGLMSKRLGDDAEGVKRYAADMDAVDRVLGRMLTSGRFPSVKYGNRIAIVDLSLEDAKDIICQLLLCSSLFVEVPKGVSHYDSFQQKICSIGFAGRGEQPAGLTRDTALTLFYAWYDGYEYLVVNEDGSCFLVDPASDQAPVKVGSRWEDPSCGFNDQVFKEISMEYCPASWEDDHPLFILDYLEDLGWVETIKGVYEFVED